MGSFLSKLTGRKELRHLIAVDIGSNTAIRSLLFDQAETDCMAIKKQTFELPKRENEADLIAPISEALRQLIFQYVKEAGRVPSQVLVGLGSHFTFNEITVEKSVRKRPREVIGSSELQGMINNFLDKHRLQIIGASPYALIHLIPFKISIDGYRVDVLGENTHGQVLEISLFATYVLNSYWEALWRLRSLWGGLELGFVSNQDAVAGTLVSILNVHEALILKIGAATTEVSILGEGVIQFTGQFEVGGDHFTKAIARRLSTGVTEAERIKQQLETVDLPEKTAETVKTAVESVAALWLSELVKLLKNQDGFVLPKLVYILGGGARLEAILQTLANTPWFDELTFLKSVEIKRLNAEDLSAKIFRNAKSPLTGPEEVSLAALVQRLAANRRNIHRGRENANLGKNMHDNIEIKINQ